MWRPVQPSPLASIAAAPAPGLPCLAPLCLAPLCFGSAIAHLGMSFSLPQLLVLFCVTAVVLESWCWSNLPKFSPLVVSTDDIQLLLSSGSFEPDFDLRVCTVRQKAWPFKLFVSTALKIGFHFPRNSFAVFFCWEIWYCLKNKSFPFVWEYFWRFQRWFEC